MQVEDKNNLVASCLLEYVILVALCCVCLPLTKQHNISSCRLDFTVSREMLLRRDPLFVNLHHATPRHSGLIYRALFPENRNIDLVLLRSTETSTINNSRETKLLINTVKTFRIPKFQIKHSVRVSDINPVPRFSLFRQQFSQSGNEIKLHKSRVKLSSTRRSHCSLRRLAGGCHSNNGRIRTVTDISFDICTISLLSTTFKL